MNKLSVLALALSMLLMGAVILPPAAHSQWNPFSRNTNNGIGQSLNPFSRANTGFGQNNFGGNNFSGNSFGQNNFDSRNSGNLNGSLSNIENQTDQIVKNVQTFLQRSGRWFPTPQGNDMQVCEALQTFKQQVGQVKRSGNNNVQMQLVQLQQSAANVVMSMQRAGIDPGTLGQMQMLQDNIQQLNNASSFTGGNPNNPFFNNGMNAQQFSNYGAQMLNLQQDGRGQLLVSGAPVMKFRQIAIETIDPVNRRVRTSFGGGRDNLQLSGVITAQTLNGITVAVDSSDKGMCNGNVNVMFSSNGQIGSVNAAGLMNGQQYAVQFNN